MNNLTTLTNEVWPTADEDNDRIQSQVRLGNIVAKYLHTHKRSYGMKVILVSAPRKLFEPFTSGNQLFEQNCPVKNCLLTNDTEKFKKTADAVILHGFRRPSQIRYFQPKPKKQVIFI